MSTLRARPAVLAAVLAIAAGAAWHVHAATAPSTVTIDDFAFGPAALTVARGTTVVWSNEDDEPHTVVSDADPKAFKSGALDTGDNFSFTFDTAGTYKYFCSIHPRMQGTVIVK